MSIKYPTAFEGTPSEDKFLPDRPILASDYKPIIESNQRLWMRPWFRVPGFDGQFTTSNTSYTQTNDNAGRDLSDWRGHVVPNREMETGTNTSQFLFRFHAALQDIDVEYQAQTVKVDPGNNQITRNTIATSSVSASSGSLESYKVTDTVARSTILDANGHLLAVEFQVQFRDNGSGTPLLRRWQVDGGKVDGTATTNAYFNEWHNY